MKGVLLCGPVQLPPCFRGTSVALFRPLWRYIQKILIFPCNLLSLKIKRRHFEPIRNKRQNYNATCPYHLAQKYNVLMNPKITSVLGISDQQIPNYFTE
jgi:hypothetical protein